jgi:membrane fusion protein (multidrug efflux system)
VPDPTKDRTRSQVEELDSDVRGPWPEEEEAQEAKGGYFKQNPMARLVLLAAVVVLAIVAVVAWRYYSVRENTDDAQIDGHITPISARVGGTVVSVNFNDNQLVKAGDVLVQLDPRDYQIAVQRAEADFANEQSNARAAETNVPISHATTAGQLAAAQAQLNAARKEATAANARVREAEANANRVAKDLERMQVLIAKDEISRQQFDAASAADAAAIATLDAARSGAAAAESHIAQAEAMVRSAETAPQQVQVTQAKFGSATAIATRASAALEQARLNLLYTTVRAASDGIVSKRSIEPGQVLQAGQPMAALVNISDLWVTANFKETQLKDMRPGQPVTIKVDAYPRELKGHIDSIGGATEARFSLLPPENATGNFVKVVQRIPVKIVFERGEDSEHLLRPGMSVVPTVRTDAK